jgi:Family of unknown function (DUF6876)
MEASKLASDLKQFHGSSHYWKHLLGFHYTDGVKYLAENAQCYWLIDLVASWAISKNLDNEEFLVFELVVNKDSTAQVTISDGNKRVLGTQEIEYTDFPLPKITIWCIEKIIILPSEY